VFCVFLCCLSLSFVIINYFVGVDEVIVLEASLVDEASSIRLMEDLVEL